MIRLLIYYGLWMSIMRDRIILMLCYRHLNFNTFHKNYGMIRLLIYYALWMSTMRDLMGHYKARWRVKIISVSSKWTRSVIRGNFRQYIFCLHIVTLRLSSAVYRHSSIPYSSSKRPIINSSTHLDSSPSSFNSRYCHVYDGDWSTCVACCHRSCLVLLCDVVTSLLQSVTPANTLHRVLLLARALLVTTRCRLLPVFVIVDPGCYRCHASTA